MRKLGLIPAAGYGKRWGFYPKFMLPCGDREWLINRAIRQMYDAGCDDVMIAVSAETVHDVVGHLRRTGMLHGVSIVENQRMDMDFWGSILAGLSRPSRYYYFMMPDTYCPNGVFERMPETGLSMGMHNTNHPENYGVLRGNEIVNKKPGRPGRAWGTLGWDASVRDYWMNEAYPETYTHAINLAIERFGMIAGNLVQMDYYYDMRDWSTYCRFITRMEGI